MDLKELRSVVEAKEAEAKALQENENRDHSTLAELRSHMNTNNLKEDKQMSENILSNAIMECRAIQVSGTGIQETVPELLRLVKNANVAAGMARYFRGRNSDTVIPLVSALPAAPAAQSESATGITPDSTAAISYKKLTPSTYMSILPITWEFAKYSVVSEGEILNLLADAFSDCIESNILSRDASSAIKGIFATGSVASTNKVTAAAAGHATLADVYAFASKLKYKNGKFSMWMAPEQFSALMSEDTDDYNFVKKELSEKGSIRGIPVYESNHISDSTTAGDSLVVGIDLGTDYGIGWADDLEIRPVVQYNSSMTYFQGIQGLCGDVINNKNVFALVAHS